MPRVYQGYVRSDKPRLCAYNGAGKHMGKMEGPSGGTPSLGPFTNVSGLAPIFGITEMEIVDSGGNGLGLFFPTPTAGSLVGYTGGPLSPFTNIRENTPTAAVQVFGLDSGSLTQPVPVQQTPVPVPEPASLLLLASALGGAYALLGRRLLLN
jgi:hypothetical protein